jgi:ribosomal protein S12 methylthiotransferase accessory factor
MFRCNSSLREVELWETLQIATALGDLLGISRVTDITRLDRIGIPVCVSIRPGAVQGSLCVNAGKGVTPDEAKAGAWMEAIEYAMAEPGAAGVGVCQVPARDLLNASLSPESLLDLCPRLGKGIVLDAPVSAVEAEHVLGGGQWLVPAELVFTPWFEAPERLLFGYSTTGLASGNTVLEASVHALAEAIERDISSFHHVQDRSLLVRPESLPDAAKRLGDMVRDAGLRLHVRWLPNPFDLPCLQAILIDPEADPPLLMNAGYGCHTHAQIAAIRAICEAAQSRLSFIHGGRDDLTDWHRLLSSRDPIKLSEGLKRTMARSACSEGMVDFEDIPDHSGSVRSLREAWDVLVSALNREGIREICRVLFTPPMPGLCVVKLVVPGLEEFDEFSNRVGPRLARFAESL